MVEDRVRELRLVLVPRQPVLEELDRPADVAGVHEPARFVHAVAGCLVVRLQRLQPLLVAGQAAGRRVAEGNQLLDDDPLRTPSRNVVRGVHVAAAAPWHAAGQEAAAREAARGRTSSRKENL